MATASAYENGLPAETTRDINADMPWRVDVSVEEIPLLIFILVIM